MLNDPMGNLLGPALDEQDARLAALAQGGVAASMARLNRNWEWGQQSIDANYADMQAYYGYDNYGGITNGGGSSGGGVGITNDGAISVTDQGLIRSMLAVMTGKSPGLQLDINTDTNKWLSYYLFNQTNSDVPLNGGVSAAGSGYDIRPEHLNNGGNGRFADGLVSYQKGPSGGSTSGEDSDGLEHFLTFAENAETTAQLYGGVPAQIAERSHVGKMLPYFNLGKNYLDVKSGKISNKEYNYQQGGVVLTAGVGSILEVMFGTAVGASGGATIGIYYFGVPKLAHALDVQAADWNNSNTPADMMDCNCSW